MRNALRSELRKLAHTRSLLAVLAAGLAIAGFGSGLLLAIGRPEEIAARLSDHGPLRFGASNFGLLLVVFGVRLFTDETQHHTIASTYIRTPDRRRVLAAKTAIAAATAALFTLAVYALVVPITVVGLHLRDLDMTFDVAATAALGVRVAVAMVLFTTLGLLVGVVLGNRTVALVAVLVWFALAESVAGSLLDIERFLPGPALQDLVAAGRGGGSSAPTAALILLVLVLVAGAAALVASRRDVA